jgi:hypothetical protein
MKQLLRYLTRPHPPGTHPRLKILPPVAWESEEQAE